MFVDVVQSEARRALANGLQGFFLNAHSFGEDQNPSVIVKLSVAILKALFVLVERRESITYTIHRQHIDRSEDGVQYLLLEDVATHQYKRGFYRDQRGEEIVDRRVGMRACKDDRSIIRQGSIMVIIHPFEPSAEGKRQPVVKKMEPCIHAANVAESRLEKLLLFMGVKFLHRSRVICCRLRNLVQNLKPWK